jgi:hypothetical protein
MTSFLSVRERVREQDEQIEQLTELLGGTADRRRRSGTLVYNEKFHQNAIAYPLIRLVTHPE